MNHASLPGEDLVSQGLADLRDRVQTREALLVSIGAPRLRLAGIHVPWTFDHPEHRLYELLAREHADSAHGRYNALIRRLVSFERALGCAIKIVPDEDALLRAIPALKESLSINVELASPDQFIPVLPGWEDRSPFVDTEGRLTVRHFDLYAQALAKIERGHDLDRSDVAAMIERGLVTRDQIRIVFEAIEPLLYRFPAIDPQAFRASVEQAVGRA